MYQRAGVCLSAWGHARAGPCQWWRAEVPCRQLRHACTWGHTCTERRVHGASLPGSYVPLHAGSVAVRSDGVCAQARRRCLVRAKQPVAFPSPHKPRGQPWLPTGAFRHVCRKRQLEMWAEQRVLGSPPRFISTTPGDLPARGTALRGSTGGLASSARPRRSQLRT